MGAVVAAALSAVFMWGAGCLAPVVRVSLGDHADCDFKANLRKSRLKADVVFSQA